MKQHLEFYDVKGWSVIPLKFRDKKPSIISWLSYMDRRATNFEIDNWFRHNTGFNNIGVVTGRVSGLAVLDFDDVQTYMSFLEAAPDFSNCLTATTGKGFHVYFKPDIHARTSTFRVNDKLHHLKQEGGYVVAPPSVHPNSTQYTFLPDGKLMEFKLGGIHNVLELIGAKYEVMSERPSNWASELCMPIKEGGRNHKAAQLCGLLIKRFPYDPGLIDGLMHAWNQMYCTPALPLIELDRLVKGEWQRYGPK
jgi:hypothetical protein